MRPRVSAAAVACLVVGLTVGIVQQPAKAAQDPPFSVGRATLDLALDCRPFEGVHRHVVLLVHGTFTSGHEHWDWNYVPLLTEKGFDVCLVTYPDRGLGDQQASAEYVANALLRIRERTGRKVDLVGHSQGASLQRWAIKFWPSARAVVDDFVLIASPSHGLRYQGSGGGPQPEAFWQFNSESNFNRVVNAGDETPGKIDYTSIYSLYDELVQPVDTAMLDRGRESRRVVNVAVQEVCPGRFVDHVTIGTTDVAVQHMVLDALDHRGPLNVDRLALDPRFCSLPDQYVTPQTVQALAGQAPRSIADGMPSFHLAPGEPPLKPYATSTTRATPRS